MGWRGKGQTAGDEKGVFGQRVTGLLSEFVHCCKPTWHPACKGARCSLPHARRVDCLPTFVGL